MVAALVLEDPTAPPRRRVVGGAHGKTGTQSYGLAGLESPGKKRQQANKAQHEQLGFTASETADLLDFFGGYEASLGIRSLHGSIEDHCMRRAPSDATVQEIVLSELDIAGGHMLLDALVEKVVGPRERTGWRRLSDGKIVERQVTPYEAWRAVRGLLAGDRTEGAPKGTIHLSKDVRPTEYLREKDGKKVTAPREWVHLLRTADGSLPTAPLSRRQRWDREDAELELYCRGWIPCHDEAPTVQPEPFTGAHEPLRARRALAAITPQARAVIEAFFGHSEKQGVTARYGQMFGETGTQLCRLIALAPTVQRELAAMVEARTTERMAAIHQVRGEQVSEIDQAPAVIEGLTKQIAEDAQRRAARIAVLDALPQPLSNDDQKERNRLWAPSAPIRKLARERKRLRAVIQAGTQLPTEIAKVRARVAAATQVADVLHAKLDAQPEPGPDFDPKDKAKVLQLRMAREKWKQEQASFLAHVQRDLSALMDSAVSQYRLVGLKAQLVSLERRREEELRLRRRDLEDLERRATKGKLPRTAERRRQKLAAKGDRSKLDARIADVEAEVLLLSRGIR